ncbi:MAG: PaaI family thioesterase [Hyphomicrobiales bacterium]|nr:PaaI family thioesterase [Hyphomicrobiales bacterium]
MSLEEIRAFLEAHFPQIGPGNDLIVEAVGPMTARLRLAQQDKHLRPGGTISGPSMFALADVAIYIAILGEIGIGDDPEKAPMSPGARTVTTNININFLRRPVARDLIGDAKLMRVGRRLAVGEVWMHSEGSEDAVAHAVGTYAIPPEI